MADESATPRRSHDLGQWWSELGDERFRTDQCAPFSAAHGIMQSMPTRASTGNDVTQGIAYLEAALPNRLAERPPLEVIENGYRRSCAHCDYHQIAHVGVTAEAQHICQRDGVTYLIMWPRG